MKSKLATTKMVYYYQGINAYGHVDKTARVELPGMGITISEAFEEWKAFMSAVGYSGMEQYELEVRQDDGDT